jgi:hypothetical protein
MFEQFLSAVTNSLYIVGVSVGVAVAVGIVLVVVLAAWFRIRQAIRFNEKVSITPEDIEAMDRQIKNLERMRAAQAAGIAAQDAGGAP